MQSVVKQEELAGLRHLTGQEKAALSEFVARLRERYADEVALVMLFGSKVRGDFDEESDLDVLVVVESDGWRFHREISFIGSRVSLDYDVNISPKAVTQTQYFSPMASTRLLSLVLTMPSSMPHRPCYSPRASSAPGIQVYNRPLGNPSSSQASSKRSTAVSTALSGMRES